MTRTSAVVASKAAGVLVIPSDAFAIVTSTPMKTTTLLVSLALVSTWLAGGAAQGAETNGAPAKPPATAWLTGTNEEKFDRVARQLRGFDLAMVEVGHRYTELYWAGEDGNWDYAKYQFEKIQHVIELAMERRTNRAPSAQWFITNAVPLMKATVESRDGTRFRQQFHIFTAACNTCHTMEKMPFVTVQVPDRRLSPVRFQGKPAPTPSSP